MILSLESRRRRRHSFLTSLEFSPRLLSDELSRESDRFATSCWSLSIKYATIKWSVVIGWNVLSHIRGIPYSYCWLWQWRIVSTSSLTAVIPLWAPQKSRFSGHPTAIGGKCRDKYFIMRFICITSHTARVQPWPTFLWRVVFILVRHCTTVSL